MSKAKSWKIRIRHILEAIEEIQNYVHGLDQSDFYEDQKTFRAVERCFLIIGEAVKHIPEDIRGVYPYLPWRRMSDMRNFVVHEYDDVEHDILWKTIQIDLPPLKTALEKLLEDTKDE